MSATTPPAPGTASASAAASATLGSVAFIGAGPGDPDLITVRGRRLIRRAALVLYAGSLVPREIVAQAAPNAVVRDSAPMSLEETHALIMATVRAGGDVARVHTGDPALYGAIREQIDLLEREGVPCEVVPGVTAAFAAAARAKVSLTVPGRSQTVILTRAPGRTPMPEAENLADLARHGAAMAVYLSAAEPEAMADALRTGGLAPETPVIVAHRVGWDGEFLQRTTLEHAPALVRERAITRQTLFLVLPGEDGAPHRSHLYDPDHPHLFRPARPADSADGKDPDDADR
ncbi:MAG: precorrin-4 C(11)-methyltransferase [Desulfovibrionaceae bacterium]|jgi:precorrin-4/cobalt-precorrin-4 C11-methyltransferase|nr:precorrin-4 C(11)-methyltransferase [Desulfovibrionaceae bacterium]